MAPENWRGKDSKNSFEKKNNFKEEQLKNRLRAAQTFSGELASHVSPWPRPALSRLPAKGCPPWMKTKRFFFFAFKIAPLKEDPFQINLTLWDDLVSF